mmetsp:Transcript_38168/g.83822  ORF Transcript_38168/g.83822 Transcript_38168/m.83822 type:complete len:425 (+) Transcript_38168:151-1425(+)
MDAFGVSVRQHTHADASGAVVPPFAIIARGASSRPSSSRSQQSHPIVNVGDRETGSASSSSNSNLIKTSGNGRSVVLLARISLVTVALLFGMLNVCLRLVYAFPNPPTPPVVGLIRGLFAALCFAPSMIRLALLHSCSTRSGGTFNAKGRTSTQGTRGLFKAAFWLGAWNVLAQGLLTVGLSVTSSSVRCSFLAQSSVVITPLISMIFGQRVKSSVWVGAFFAMVGLFVLATADGSNSGGQVGIDHATGAGDLLVLCCAVCWSIYLYQFGVVADLYDNVALQAATCGMRAIMYIAWFLVAALIRQSKEGAGWEGVQTMWPGWRDLRVWGLLVFSAVGSGALAGVLQQRGQAVLSAAESNIVLSSEPIFASLFAWMLLGELMSPRENLGGVIIFCAAIIASGAFEGLFFTSHRRKAAEDDSPSAR